MVSGSRKDFVYIILTGLFVTNAVLGELIGGKLIEVFGLTMSLGVIPWPVVFLTTDLINEHFGKEGVKRITFATIGLIIYAFIILFVSMNVPASPISPISDDQFRAVFGQSMWIIVGSVIAFAAGQLVDVSIFWFFRNRTGKRMLWLRTTGSTVVSQIIDSFVVVFIAFYFSGKLSFEAALQTSVTNYSYKLVIALLLTPLIYASHALIDRYLEKQH